MSILLIYNHYVGIRNEHSLWEGILESMEEMGIGLLLTIFILWITQRITPDMSVREIFGKIIVEAVTVAIGISVGKSQLMGSNGEGKKKDEKDPLEGGLAKNILRTVNISLCGAILIASNIAPTDEVVVIAFETPTYKLFLLALISLGIGGAILYYINFTGSKKWVAQPTKPADVFWGIIIMYAVSLAASSFMLWFFGRFEDISIEAMVAETVVLGFPAALGASAGRLLIQT